MSTVHDGCALPSRNGWHFYDSIDVVQAVNKFAVAIESNCHAIGCSVFLCLPKSRVISSSYVYRLALASGGLGASHVSLAKNNKALEVMYGWAM
jgi:hypothetical protein